MTTETEPERDAANRRWATELEPLLVPIEEEERLIEDFPDWVLDKYEEETRRIGRYPKNDPFMLVRDLFGWRVVYMGYVPTDLIVWVSREEAVELVYCDRWERARNYELADNLHREGYWDHEIGEMCPFNAHWSTWGSKHPEGIKVNEGYMAHRKVLYSVEDCPHCGESYGGWGGHGPKYSGPNWDGTCIECDGRILDPPEGILSQYHRKYS